MSKEQKKYLAGARMFLNQAERMMRAANLAAELDSPKMAISCNEQASVKISQAIDFILSINEV